MSRLRTMGKGKKGKTCMSSFTNIKLYLYSSYKTAHSHKWEYILNLFYYFKKKDIGNSVKK
ncbi:MAG: hypothetical protein OHK0057_04620 [Thermoflexibacter sp.]